MKWVPPIVPPPKSHAGSSHQLDIINLCNAILAVPSASNPAEKKVVSDPYNFFPCQFQLEVIQYKNPEIHD